jgi:sulfate transport system substrate-binding protein
MKKYLHGIVSAGLIAFSSITSAQTLLNASYDVARKFYKDYNTAFAAHYKKTTGKDVKIDKGYLTVYHQTNFGRWGCRGVQV